MHSGQDHISNAYNTSRRNITLAVVKTVLSIDMQPAAASMN